MHRGESNGTCAPPNPGRLYWLAPFRLKTWEMFRKRGGASLAVSDPRAVDAIGAGDVLLCYLADGERWVGLLHVVAAPAPGASRVAVAAAVALPVARGVPFVIIDSRDNATGMTPSLCTAAFGDAVAEALLERGREEAMMRPLDLSGEPPVVENPTLHTEIQWLLAKLGDEMGLEVWVARNDRHRAFKGQRFTGLPRLVDELPVHFDARTTRTVELIDVLWLRGQVIVSAFEIERTTSIYTGLLRMADLGAMQPNLKIPLFLVAGEERRKRVFGEVNRPAFSQRDPPLNRLCRFIAFEKLRTHIERIEGLARHMNPSFLTEVSEACDRDPRGERR